MKATKEQRANWVQQQLTAASRHHAQAEDDLKERHQQNLELECRKYRRRGLLARHNLEQDLLREVGNKLKVSVVVTCGANALKAYENDYCGNFLRFSFNQTGNKFIISFAFLLRCVSNTLIIKNFLQWYLEILSKTVTATKQVHEKIAFINILF